LRSRMGPFTTAFPPHIHIADAIGDVCDAEFGSAIRRLRTPALVDQPSANCRRRFGCTSCGDCFLCSSVDQTVPTLACANVAADPRFSVLAVKFPRRNGSRLRSQACPTKRSQRVRPGESAMSDTPPRIAIPESTPKPAPN
jgi:hypothetical protein